MVSPLRLVFFDATQKRRAPRALGFSWELGGYLYRGLGRIDAAFGVTSLREMFAMLESYEPDRRIAEIQFWGHGKWGCALVGDESLDRRALEPGHPLHRGLCVVRERLDERSLIWFRTCETLGADAGSAFARALADFTGADIAGHTYEIGFYQSGLHRLRPGASPTWSLAEGLARGTPASPERASKSDPSQPNTITCLTGVIPPWC